MVAGLPIVVPNETMVKLWDLSHITPGAIAGCATLVRYITLYEFI